MPTPTFDELNDDCPIWTGDVEHARHGTRETWVYKHEDGKLYGCNVYVIPSDGVECEDGPYPVRAVEKTVTTYEKVKE